MGEDGKSVVGKVLEEVWEKGNYGAVDQYFAPDFVDHTPGLSGEDREGQKRAAQQMREAFPDLHTELSDMMVEGDRVLLHYQATGTHKGSMFGASPTNKKVCMGGMSLYRIEGGKIKEHWGYFDTFSLMEQLGMAHGFQESAGGQQSGPGSFSQAEQRAASHNETTVRSGQTDLYAGMKKEGQSS